MHEFVSFNTEIIHALDVRLSAVSPAILYGRGIFTTIAIREGQPFLWDRHWTRLEENAGRIACDISKFPEEQVKKALEDLVKQNMFALGQARITFFDESPGKLWPSEGRQGASLLITTRYPRIVSEHFRLTVSPYLVNSTSPLAGIKSCNYLENLFALEEANARGFDEAVRLNERGEIASACMANIFWEKDGRLFTPGLNSGCLPGTTRGNLIETRGAIEVDAGIEDLKNADKITLTSAGLGIVDVGEFDVLSCQLPPALAGG